jgi:plastocyanin
MTHTRFGKTAALVFAVACGSSTGPGGGGTTPPPNGGGSGGGSGASVSVQDFSFAPKTLTVKVGTTVTWTNAGPSAHTATSDAGVWTSGTLGAPSGGGYGGGSPGGSYSFKFMTAGTYTYHCTFHPPSQYPSFTGTITVTP